MKLPYIFSDNAIFQTNAEINFYGETKANQNVEITIQNNKTKESTNFSGKADKDGKFEVKVKTPNKASFTEYTITIKADETKTLNNVLFGEVWIATGQSNMEISNYCMPEHNLFQEKLRGKKIRFFHVDYQGLNDPEMKSPFPYEPQNYGTGAWYTTTDPKTLDWMSACATGFAAKLYEDLNAKDEIPVGILDASWGGTPITAYLKKSDIDEDPVYSARLKEIGKYPFEENWNKATNCLPFQQSTAQYNVKIAPLTGAKARGLIWYQGEHETGGEYWERSYAESLRFFHKTYSARFAVEKDNFLMISSLIHYWRYGEEGECNLAYINGAFIETAVAEPNKFAYASNGDFEPIWGQHFDNHPIHPLHKYPLGDRMARVALANVYGKKYKKAPATLAKVSRIGENLKLTFRDSKEGLYVKGDYNAPGRTDGFRPVKTLYVAGKDGKYLPAEAKILSKNTMLVKADGINFPKFVAYNVQSMEPGANLYSGEYPVSPFLTEKETKAKIEQRPWYFMENERCWANKILDEMKADLFYHPVWFAENGSEVCSDPAFHFETGMSLRICVNDDNEVKKPVIGAYVKSYPYMTLDMTGYKFMEMNVFNNKDWDIEVIFTTPSGEKSFKFEKVCDIDAGWSRFKADIRKLKETDIKRMTFRFTANGDKDYFRFVNVEKIRLATK